MPQLPFLGQSAGELEVTADQDVVCNRPPLLSE
jgi:hypothetical protein